MERLKLKNWLLLSSYRKKIAQRQDVVDNILASVALSDKETDYGVLPWYQTQAALHSLSEANLISIKFPILNKIERNWNEKLPWDYPERDWYYWAHLLASKYGWLLEYIAELDIDDAVALLQESEVEDQLVKEWEYQLSEIAYPYDKSTKKSKFKPLSRPHWMQIPIVVAKLRRMPANLMPVGIVKMNEDIKSK